MGFMVCYNEQGGGKDAESTVGGGVAQADIRLTDEFGCRVVYKD